MTVTFVDPRATPSLPADPYDLPLLGTEQPVTLAFLSNGFPDSVPFMEHVEKAVLALAPAGTAARRFAKPNASTLVSPKVLDEMAATCDALVTAYGH